MFRSTRYRKGFTLIELLIVVAIIGIIASILIPNLIDALQKAKQKRTVAEMRNLGSAWMNWLTDQIAAGSAGQNIYDASTLDIVTLAELRGYLRPSDNFFYTNQVAAEDGWGFSLQYCLNSVLQQDNVIMICSPGRNGAFGENPTGAGQCCSGGVTWQVGNFIGTDYDQDMVWADGQLIRYPGGNN